MRTAMWTVAGLLIIGSMSGCKDKNKEPVQMSQEQSGDAGVMDAGVYSTDTGTDSGAADNSGYGSYPVTYESSSVPGNATGSVPPADGGYSGGSGRMHTVQKGDTLYKLARQYYNSASRWRDIHEANRDQISDPNRLKVGQTLVIP